MDYIQASEPIRVHGLVVASYGYDDPALGCPVEYINLKVGGGGCCAVLFRPAVGASLVCSVPFGACCGGWAGMWHAAG